MRLLLNLIICLAATTSFAKSFDASKVTSTATGWVQPEDGGPTVGFQFSILKDETSWIAAKYPENQRYVKYGPWTIDRNKPQEILRTHRILGMFKFRDEVYLVGMPKPYDSLLANDEPKQTVTHTEPMIYKVVGRNGELETSYRTSLMRNGVGGTLYLGLTGLSLSMLDYSATTGSIGGTIFTSLLSLVSAGGTAIMGYGLLSPIDGEAELATKADLNVLAAVRKDSSNNQASKIPTVRKRDPNNGWSANNIEVVNDDSSVVAFTDLFSDTKCEDLLSFRKAEYKIVSSPGASQMYIE